MQCGYSLTKCGDFKTNRTLLTDFAKRNETRPSSPQYFFELKIEIEMWPLSTAPGRTTKQREWWNALSCAHSCADPSLSVSLALVWEYAWRGRPRATLFFKMKCQRRGRERERRYFWKNCVERWNSHFRLDLKYVACINTIFTATLKTC